MRETRLSGSMSGRWRRSTACGSEPRRGNPDTWTYHSLNHRATSRLYFFPLKASTNINVLIALMTRAGGETVSPDSY